MAKLDLISQLDLPPDLFDHTSIQELERYRQRVAVEESFELRRHPEPMRLTWLAAFAYVRGRAITDGLVDLLIETIHHIGARAERKAERELLEDLKRVSGKQNLLFELADAALTNPDGIVREVVYPVVGEQTLYPIEGPARADRFQQLRAEKKHFLDTIKLIAYRAETALAQLAREKMHRLDDARSLKASEQPHR